MLPNLQTPELLQCSQARELHGLDVSSAPIEIARESFTSGERPVIRGRSRYVAWYSSRSSVLPGDAVLR